jgi:hypothetical protein
MKKINYKSGEDFFGGRSPLQTEVVNGICPNCNRPGILVSLFKSHYRCITCGSDLEQKVNGIISYIPMGDPSTTFVVEKDG